MFQWHREMGRLEFSVGSVLKLMQSLSDVQIVLPGMPGQQATAYLCAFSGNKGIRVAVALLLRDSRRFAIYLNDQGEVPQQSFGPVLKEGIRFAESMGFLLDDLDFEQLDSKARATRWKEFPPHKGIEPLASKYEPPAVPASAPTPETSVENPAPRTLGGPPESRAGKKRPPTPGEMAAKKTRFLERLGRFLASL